MHPRKNKLLQTPEYRPVALGNLDRRTWQGRLLRDTRFELTQHVGGNPSVTQVAMIEQLAQLRLRLALFNQRFSERGEMTDHDRRSYLAFANSHTRLLQRLDDTVLARPKSPPTLQDYLTVSYGGSAGRKA
jgi:hypothetical protein